MDAIERVKIESPLNGECQNPSLVYRAEVVNDSNDEEKFYFGLADTTFKERHRNHIRDFKQKKYENSTELAQKCMGVPIHVCVSYV